MAHPIQAGSNPTVTSCPSSVPLLAAARVSSPCLACCCPNASPRPLPLACSLWFFIPTLAASLFSPTAPHAVTGSAASCPATGALPACIPRPGSHTLQPLNPQRRLSKRLRLHHCICTHCNHLCASHGRVCLGWSGLHWLFCSCTSLIDDPRRLAEPRPEAITPYVVYC